MENSIIYLTEKDVSKITGLALPTLRNYRHQRKGPVYIKIGRAVRYADEDIHRFMQNRKIETDE